MDEPRGGFRPVPRAVMETSIAQVGRRHIEKGGCVVDRQVPHCAVPIGTYAHGGTLKA